MFQQRIAITSAVLISLGILLAVSSETATAGIIIDVANTSINAGQSGAIDVFVHKDIGDPDWNILLAGYSFSITPNPGAVGSLEFDALQPTTEQSNATYLFSAFQPTGNFSGTLSNVFQYDGGDNTNNVTDFAVVGSSNLLLAQLNVSHILPLLTPPSAAAGSTYMVSLIPGTDFFFDDGFNQIAATQALGSGIITINGAAAVPEPSSVILFASITGWFGFRRMRRR